MKKLSLNAKIYLVLCVFICASIAISVIGLRNMSEIKDSLNSIVTGPTVRISNATKIKDIFLSLIVVEKNIIIETTQEGMNKQLARMEELDKEFLKLWEFSYSVALPMAKANYLEVKKHYDAWKILFMEIKALGLKNENEAAGTISITKSREHRLVIDKLMDDLVVRNESFMQDQIKHAEETYTDARTQVTLASVLSIVAGLILATYILRALNQSIGEVIGNLTASSQQVTSAAQQIATSAQELSAAATEQASSLEETSSSIEEMSSMVQKNAESAKRTSELAMSSSNSAEKGKQVVLDMIHAIDDISVSNVSIQRQIDESNAEIAEIVKVIAEIGNKTKVINDIVFQTKLLSFNASVEAARAGDNGKGFAVVAEEVGNLAQMSGNAAKEITAMLDSSIKKVEDIVSNTKLKVGHLIEDGKHKVESGNHIAKACGIVLDEIVENVATVTAMANEIATACHEQSIGVQEITKAMNQLDQVTQTNATTSEESASAAQQLSSQADALHSAVGVLVVTIKGEGAKMHQTTSRRAPVSSKKNTAPKALTVHADNVVSIKQAKAAPKKVDSRTKKAVGFEVDKIPSENDPRFEDV
jgi:methyl-accepting chemotaxis protein